MHYVLLVLSIILGIFAIAPHAFAATAQVTITAGSGADQSCVAAKTCFSPNVLNIAPGDTVTWTNTDKLGHTATNGKPTDNQTGTVWDSSLIKAGGTYSFTFQNAGTYNYFCMVHPWMTGEIIVGNEGPQSIPIQPPSTSQNFPPTTNADIKITQGSGSSQACSPAINCYEPNFFEIALGKTITWGNDDNVGHTVTSGRPSDPQTGTIFDSGVIEPGQTWRLTLTNAGTYYYFDQIHPWMTGSFIIVNTQSTPPPPTPTPYPIPQPNSANVVTITSGAGADQSCVSAKNCFSPSVIQVPAGATVTWQNNDRLGHTSTSGNPTDNQTGTVWDSSLIKAGGTYSFTFYNAGSYNYFCMVHPWMTGEIIVGNGISSYPPPSQPPVNVVLTVTTDKSTYNFGDTVNVQVAVSGSSSGQNVAISALDPTGNIMVSRTVTTDSQGSGTLQFKISDTAKTGTYQVISTVSVGGSNYKSTSQFTVQAPTQQVSIISVQATDQQGNPVSSFTRGANGFVKVVLSSQSGNVALTTVNLFGSDSTSLGIGSIKSTLGSGQSEIVVSFYISNDAKTGTATIYADAYSDWPSKGGIALTGESQTTVGIQ